MAKTKKKTEAGPAMPRVTLEVTWDSWTWTVFAGGEQIAQHTMKREEGGLWRGVQKGDIYDQLEELDDLAEAIDLISPTDICKALTPPDCY